MTTEAKVKTENDKLAEDCVAKPKRTIASLTRLEKAWLKRRICSFCEANLCGTMCFALSGDYTLPVIEGVRDKEEVVDLGDKCNMDERRAHALLSYRSKDAPDISRTISGEAYG